MALSIVPAAAVAEEGDTTGLRAWEAPSECILLDELRTGVAVQRTAAFKEVRSVEGKVQTSDSGWSVMLTVYEGELRLGERVLELPGEDCRAHDETLALVVALLLEHGPPPAHESAEIDSEPAVAAPRSSEPPNA